MIRYFIYSEKFDCLLTNRLDKEVAGKAREDNAKIALTYHFKSHANDPWGYKKLQGVKEDYKIIAIEIK